MNTPQSTKKIDIQAIEDVFTRTGCEFDPKGHWIKVTDPHRTYKQLLTILKETCEAVIGEDEKVPQSETGINLAPIIGTEPRNQLRADQRTTLNNLLGADDE